MGRLKQALARLMAGRYGGNDELGRFLMIGYLVLILVNLLLGSKLLAVVSLAMVFYQFFRIFSKNYAARTRENRRFLSLKQKLVNRGKLWKNQFRDRKTHVYRSCPFCKSTVRLPKKKGDHGVCCPCCRREFRVKI